jgi:hypothetical protein
VVVQPVLDGPGPRDGVEEQQPGVGNGNGGQEHRPAPRLSPGWRLRGGYRRNAGRSAVISASWS